METDFRTYSSVSSNGKSYFSNIFHSGWWKEIFRLVETVYFCTEALPFSGNHQ